MKVKFELVLTQNEVIEIIRAVLKVQYIASMQDLFLGLKNDLIKIDRDMLSLIGRIAYLEAKGKKKE